MQEPQIIIRALARITEIMYEEITLITQNNWRAAKAICQEKQDIAAFLHMQEEKIRGDAVYFQGLNTADRESIRELIDKLQIAATYNAKKLQEISDMKKVVMDSISHAIREVSKKYNIYSYKGKILNKSNPFSNNLNIVNTNI